MDSTKNSISFIWAVNQIRTRDQWHLGIDSFAMRCKHSGVDDHSSQGFQYVLFRTPVGNPELDHVTDVLTTLCVMY